MKKIILLLFTIITYHIALAQCTPDPLYADSSWGIWPDEQTNFVSGDIGVAYQQIVNFKVPIDAGDNGVSYSDDFLYYPIILQSTISAMNGDDPYNDEEQMKRFEGAVELCTISLLAHLEKAITTNNEYNEKRAKEKKLANFISCDLSLLKKCEVIILALPIEI